MPKKSRFLDASHAPALSKETIAIIFILIAALCLRLYHLGFHDLWCDEVISVKYAGYPWDNWNAPLYWILLHFWIKIFGISEFSLRLPSAIFSFLSVMLTYILGKNLFNKKVGIWASIFIALSPFHLWYAQEARDYSMILFLGLLSSHLFFKTLREESSKLRILFVIVSLLGVYTNYFYVFLILAQCLFLIFSRKAKLRLKDITPFFIIAFGFSLYLSKLFEKFYFVFGGFWLAKPNLKSLLITFENFLLGYNVQPPFYFVIDIFIFALFIFTIIRLRNKKMEKSFIFCLFLLLPIALAFIFSNFLFSIYLDRSLIIFSPYFYIISALFIDTISKRWVKYCILTVLCLLLMRGDSAFFLDQIYFGQGKLTHHQGAYLKKPFKPIVKFIANNFKEGDAVGVTSASPPIIPSLSFYSDNKISFYYFFSPGMIDSNWKRPILESKFELPFSKIEKLNFKRIWIISSDAGFRTGALDKNSLIIKNYLDKKFKLEFAQEFDGLWLFRYRR